ncbi:hypothetical protein AV530_018657 [Patagioenas fasciata monilis]|uniref:Uncharacterized protein n=1 Tax=Patagioenas fasciata monilis TaxID=372326 RepID=A0A1V4JJG0_PATFA|nr:hypothetical protein AV530_018657 [Patagioenas fasciata monilis]
MAPQPFGAVRTSFAQSNKEAEIRKHLGGQSLTTTTLGIPLEAVISLPFKAGVKLTSTTESLILIELLR